MLLVEFNSHVLCATIWFWSRLTDPSELMSRLLTFSGGGQDLGPAVGVGAVVEDRVVNLASEPSSGKRRSPSRMHTRRRTLIARA